MVLVAFILFVGMLALSLHVATALGVSALVLAEIYSTLPILRAAGEIAWTGGGSFLLVSVPLYILLGEILLRSGVADGMYMAISRWIGWLPGGLMHANVAASAMFAATSGSSVATAATIGTVALPQMDKEAYHRPLFLGSIVAGGTLGILIPPSITMIVYGVLTETSIPRLYLAGFIPGIMLAGIFSLTIAILCVMNPGWGGRPNPATWAERLAVFPDLWPPLLIFLVVIGTIYTGFATATESAAFGVVAALVIAAVKGRFRMTMLMEALESTVRVTSMLMLIIVFAFIFNFVINSIGLVQQLVDAVKAMQLSKYETLFAVIVVYIILGCFMETMSMMIAIVPATTQVMVAVGFDPVWFGIIIVLLMEMALITPPVGMNLYVVQGLRSDLRFQDVVKGSVPFMFCVALALALLTLFPEIALFLPDRLFR